MRSSDSFQIRIRTVVLSDDVLSMFWSDTDVIELKRLNGSGNKRTITSTVTKKTKNKISPFFNVKCDLKRYTRNKSRQTKKLINPSLDEHKKMLVMKMETKK